MRGAWVILSAAAVLAAAAVQPVHGQDVLVGVKGGLGITDMTIEEDVFSIDTDSRTGFIGGAFLNLGLGEIFAIQPEVLYARKGAEVDDNGFVLGLRGEYVEVPLLFMARIPVGESQVRPLVFGGGAVAFETGCEVSGTEGAVTATFDCDDPDIQLERKKTDFGLVFGGGLEAEAGRIVLTADGRYNLGLVNLDEDAGATAKHRAFSILAGVGIRLR